jgi:ubiquinone/menaquinone biosynthesis C-methylase UbiE
MNDIIESQEKVWDEIAPEWDDFKQIPARHVVEFLENQTGKVLDLGSGSGRNILQIKNGLMYLVDFSQKMLDLAEQKAVQKGIKIETKKGQLFSIPYEDEFFDSAICISALHCISGKENRKKSIQELYRVLKKDTQALIGVWNLNSKRFKGKRPERMIGWQDKGQRYYYLHTENEIHKMFEEAGFKIIKIQNSEMMINFIVKK